MNELKDPEEIYKDLLHYRWGPIWDGNVNSKWLRDRSVDAGLISRSHGFQILTPKGVEWLVNNKYLNESTWRHNPMVKANSFKIKLKRLFAAFITGSQPVFPEKNPAEKK